MIVEFEWNSGLVVGLVADTIMIYDEETETMADDPANVIYLHLGILSLAFIFA
jgi:hypothetical protein